MMQLTISMIKCLFLITTKTITIGMAFFESHDWNTGFVCWTLLLCLTVR